MNQQICGNTYAVVQHNNLTRKQQGAIQLNEVIAARNKAMEGMPGAILDRPVPVPASITLRRITPKTRSDKWFKKMRRKNPARIDRHFARRMESQNQ